MGEAWRKTPRTGAEAVIQLPPVPYSLSTPPFRQSPIKRAFPGGIPKQRLARLALRFRVAGNSTLCYALDAVS